MRARLIDATSTSTITLAQAEARTASTPFGWIEVRATGPDDNDAKEFLTALGFDQVAVAYAMRSNVSGMFQRHNDELVGTTWISASPSQTPSNINFAWNSQRLVTIRFSGDSEMDNVVRQATQSATTLFGHPTTAPPIILQMVLAELNRQITALELQVAGLDAAIVDGVKPAQLGALRSVRLTCSPLAQRFPGFADALSAALIDPATTAGLDSAGVTHLQSYATHVQDTVSRIGDLADGLRSALQDYQTEVGNRQGDRINQLTIVSILFLPVTFLTGYFGMNFQWLDNELLSLGSWLALGVLLPILVVVWSAVALARKGYLTALLSKRKGSTHTADMAAPAESGPTT